MSKKKPTRRERAMSPSALGRAILRAKNRIAAERDKLRELLDEANSIADDCDLAVALLDDAADTLSKYL